MAERVENIMTLDEISDSQPGPSKETAGKGITRAETGKENKGVEYKNNTSDDEGEESYEERSPAVKKRKEERKTAECNKSKKGILNSNLPVALEASSSSGKERCCICFSEIPDPQNAACLFSRSSNNDLVMTDFGLKLVYVVTSVSNAPVLSYYSCGDCSEQLKDTFENILDINVSIIMTNRMRSLNSLNEALADGCPLCESNSRTEFADLGTFTKHMEGHLLFPMKPEELAKDNIRVITTDKKVIVTKDLVPSQKREKTDEEAMKLLTLLNSIDRSQGIETSTSEADSIVQISQPWVLPQFQTPPQEDTEKKDVKKGKVPDRKVKKPERKITKSLLRKLSDSIGRPVIDARLLTKADLKPSKVHSGKSAKPVPIGWGVPRAACSQCPKVFKNLSPYAEHLVKEHNADYVGLETAFGKVRGLPCPTCKNVFRSYGSLNKHCILTHKTTYNVVYGCEICGKVCTALMSYTNHLNYHIRTFKALKKASGSRDSAGEDGTGGDVDYEEHEIVGETLEEPAEEGTEVGDNLYIDQGGGEMDHNAQQEENSYKRILDYGHYQPTTNELPDLT